METASATIGHVMLDAQFHVVDIDDGYATLLGYARDAVIGRPSIDFGHPDERTLATTFLHRIWDNPGMHSGTIRHRHADGRMIWVNIWGSRMGSGPSAVVMFSCRPMDCLEGDSSVRAQWQMARLLLHALDAGKRAFGPELIGNPATEILLHAYVAEAEARSIQAEEFARRTDVTWPLTYRWLQALIDVGFAEPETPEPLGPNTPISLSPRALCLLEALFGALVTVMKAQCVPA